MTFLEDLWKKCSERKYELVLFFALPTCVLIGMWLPGEAPITISIEPSDVLVGGQAILSCQLSHAVTSNTSVRWYKTEKGRDAPLCSSSSLGGVVEQCQDEEQWRIAGHWKGRALLLAIWEVQVADEGTYVCAVNSSILSQEVTTHLNVTEIGYKPTLDRDLQEENTCCYTCKSKRWYPKPEVIWTNYGGDTIHVEAKTNVTWSERDHFTVQSTITVPCDDVDVMCVVKLIKSKISQSGSMNEIVPQSSTCAYKGKTRGSYKDPRVMWVNHQGEDLSSLAQTSILLEMDDIFAIESSIEVPCGQPPPSFVTTDKKHHLYIAHQSEKCNLSWKIYFLLLLILQAYLQGQNAYLQGENEELQSQQRAARDAEKELFTMQHQKGAMESSWDKGLQEVSQQIQALHKTLQPVLESTQHELQLLRAQLERSLSKEEDTAKRSFSEDDLAELEKKLGRTVEANTMRALEYVQENMERTLSEKLAVLQSQRELSRSATPAREEQTDTQTSLLKLSQDVLALKGSLESMQASPEFVKMKCHKVDVTLDADTAHPRLEISDHGKSVKDSGSIRKVPSKEKRFDSHLCVLAKEGYTRGRRYWEVDVGKRSSWTLGIARESVMRKGILTVSPQNGFWAIGFSNGREYWAYSEPWCHLSVSGNLQRVGIFLDMAAKQLSFYNIRKKAALYTFSIADGSIQEGKFLPFFSTGPAAAKPDTEPLKIVQGFNDDLDDDD